MDQSSEILRPARLPRLAATDSQETNPPHALVGMPRSQVPDPAHLALFNLFPIWGDVKAHIDVPTQRLDAVPEVAVAGLRYKSSLGKPN